jgi:hypothetical protein
LKNKSFYFVNFFNNMTGTLNSCGLQPVFK